MLSGKLGNLVKALDGIEGPRIHRHTDLLRDVSAVTLDSTALSTFAEGPTQVMPAEVTASAKEAFQKEIHIRVNGIGAGLFSGFDEHVDVEVAFDRVGRPMK